MGMTAEVILAEVEVGTARYACRSSEWRQAMLKGNIILLGPLSEHSAWSRRTAG